MQKQSATILSAELSGFQILAESLPPNEITPLLGDIHALVEKSVRLHQGKINRFTGDIFLIIFQTGKSATKHALDAAFELKDQLESFVNEKQTEQPLTLKVGIASGGIIQAGIGEGLQQQTLMGEAVNHAMRISRFAGEDQLLTDDKTMVGLKDDFEFQKLEPIPLKGGTEILPIFEVTGKKRKKLVIKPKSERKIISEMVGRSREMEQLEWLISNLAVGKGAIVNIVGKAGMGKSRLMAEMKVQPIMEKVLVLEGRALSTGQNLSFHPITNLIKSWAGITEDDLPSASSEKLYQGIKRNTPEQADEIYAFLATMMGLPLEGKYKERVKGIEGEALEKLILKNLRDLIIASTKDKPRIYLVEDMHWSDSSSLTLFESLYKLSLNHPVMFINVLRPGYKETGDYILKYLVDHFPGDHSTINISSLLETDAEQLIYNLLRKVRLPAETEQMIIRKTEGNPFFIEEVIRSFIDEGIIEIHDNDFRVTEKIEQVSIPETINEVILSRVDKLDEKTKELLKTASVIGRNFYFKVLEEAADTIGELDERLQYLKDVQLIGESKKKDEIEYLFKHALAQQATYESIVMNTKKEMHLKIARSIEKLFAENLNEFYATLAHHYEMAGNKEKTEEYLLKAGDEAMKSGASKEAIHYYNKALAMTERTSHGREEPKVFELQEKLGYAHYALGQNIRATEYFLKVTGNYGFVNIPDKRILFSIRVIYSLARLFLKLLLAKRNNLPKAAEEDERKMKLLVYLGEAMVSYDPGKGTLFSLILGMGEPLKFLAGTNYGMTFLLNLNITFHLSGRALWLGKLLNQYLRHYVKKDNNFVYFAYLYYLSPASYFSGKLLTDTSDDKIMFEYGMNKGRIWAATTHHAFKGAGYVELGEKHNVFRIIENLKILVTEMEHSFSLAQIHRVKITWQLKNRKLDELLSEADKAIEIIGKTDHTSVQMVANAIVSMAYSFKGNLAKASEYHQIAVELSKKLWTKYYLSTIELAGVHLHMAKMKVNEPDKGDVADFLSITKKLLKVSHNIHCYKTEAYRLRALALYHCGKQKAALSNFSRSIQFAQWYGARLELSRTFFETGKFLSDSNVKYNELNGHPAGYYLEEARTMFEEMDLQWDLEELRKFVSGQTTP
jgi:class 3 adenylate cyclase/tetratricopeptide (TPR) repeat protein